MEAAAPRFRPLRLLLLLLLVVVSAEVGVRVAEGLTGRSWVLPERPEPRDSLYQPHPYIGYVARPDHTAFPGGHYEAHVNHLGFRGPEISVEKPPGTYRIACLGGSTTWSTGATGDEKAWPAVFEALLDQRLAPGGPWRDVEVINAGLSGYTLMESFINLKQRILPLHPDLIVIYHACNDAQAIRTGDFKTDYTNLRRSWTEPAPPPLADRLLGWSHLYGLLRGPDADDGGMALQDRLYVEDFENLPLHPVAELDPGVRNFFWTLREAVAITRLHGVRIALCTFAWDQDPAPTPARQRFKDGLVAAMERLNGAIRQVAQVDHTLLIDLHGLGPAHAEDFDDVVHFNDAGNRQAAWVVARSLLEADVLGEGATLASGAPPAGTDGH